MLGSLKVSNGGSGSVGVLALAGLEEDVGVRGEVEEV